jgi:hypothetical protein
MAISSENLQALIDETDALNCDDPSTLETIPLTAPPLDLYRIVGKLLSSRPPSTYWLSVSLSNSWTFAHPFEIADLPESKYLIRVSSKAHVDKIMELGPWNIKGSLLVLKPWTPELTFDEVIPIHCPFWVQAHSLPLQNMTARNAISIAKSLGTLSPVVPSQTPVIVSTHHLRFRVAIDTTRPLVPRFSLPRTGKSAIWIRYLYERLVDYCTLCGLIGHRKSFCPAPPPQGPQDKYGISLRAFVLSGPRSSYAPSLPITASSTIQHDTKPTTPDIASALICVPSSQMKSQSLRFPGAQVLHHCTMQLGAQATPTQTVHPPHVAAVNPYLRSYGQELASSLASPSVGPSSDKGKSLYTSLDFSAHAMD